MELDRPIEQLLPFGFVGTGSAAGQQIPGFAVSLIGTVTCGGVGYRRVGNCCGVRHLF
jgi:hypothetical protein